MADQDVKTLRCVKCRQVYPAGTLSCPLDQGELVPEAVQLIGSLFADKYEILSLIGEGGMSRVYKATHTLMKRTVAVKLLHEESTGDLAARDRFQREAELASALSHPNVVTVHDFGLTPTGQAYFIMDCLEGMSLDEMLEHSGCLQLEQAIDIFTQACDGLEHAHGKGIVHRDIKPSNLVIVKQDGRELVKLVDFGIAKALISDKEKKHLTKTGEIFGTPVYMSPEQCNGSLLDARSDIYSLGCLMYEVLAGEPPLVGGSFIGTVLKQINEQPKPMKEMTLHRSIPAPIEAVVFRCLEKDPDNRYHSTSELKQALIDAAFQAGLTGSRFHAVGESKPATARADVVNTTDDSGSKSYRETIKPNHRSKLIAVGLVSGMALFGAGWFIFVYPGIAGGGGTIWQQIEWQAGMSQAATLVTEKKYFEAQRVLERCLVIAKPFTDDAWRRATLNRLVEAADLNHDFDVQRRSNEMLAAISDSKVNREYALIMSMLQEWQRPAPGEMRELEKQQRAVAFGDRIAQLGDNLAIRSVQKQQLLLTSAIAAFDALDLGHSMHSLRFRYALADSYATEQHYGDGVPLLKESLKLFSEKPRSSAESQLNVKMLLLLGQSQRIQAKSASDLEEAAANLERALTLAREVVPPDPTLVGYCTDALVIFHRLSQTPHDDAQAPGLKDKAFKSATIDRACKNTRSIKPQTKK